MENEIKTHAFVIFCPQEKTLALRAINILDSYWKKSEIHVYSSPDFISNSEFEKERALVRSINTDSEKDVIESMINAINHFLVVFAQPDSQIRSFTFLLPGLIPLFPDTFYDFINNFESSQFPISFCPQTAKSMVIDIRNLHFNITSEEVKSHSFTLKRQDEVKKSIFDHIEYNLMANFDISFGRGWKHKSFLTWKISFGNHFSQGIYPNNLNFVYKSYYPENSILYSHDLNFWNHYEKLSIFEKDIPLNTALPLS